MNTIQFMYIEPGIILVSSSTCRVFLLREGQIFRQINFPWQMRLQERLQLFLFEIELLIVTGCLIGIGQGIL